MSWKLSKIINNTRKN